MKHNRFRCFRLKISFFFFLSQLYTFTTKTQKTRSLVPFLILQSYFIVSSRTKRVVQPVWFSFKVTWANGLQEISEVRFFQIVAQVHTGSHLRKANLELDWRGGKPVNVKIFSVSSVAGLVRGWPGASAPEWPSTGVHLSVFHEPAVLQNGLLSCPFINRKIRRPTWPGSGFTRICISGHWGMSGDSIGFSTATELTRSSTGGIYREKS